MSHSHRLLNTTTRPVELHLTAGVTVIPALEETTCTPDDLSLGQVRVLRRNGVLTDLPASVEEDGEPEPSRAAAAGNAKRRGGSVIRNRGPKGPKTHESDTNS
jgi:hypothetical protein